MSVVLPLVIVDEPTVVMGRGVLWVEFEGLIKISKGKVVLPLVIVDEPAIVI